MLRVITIRVGIKSDFPSIVHEIAWLIRESHIDDSELSGLSGVNYNIIENIDVGLRYNHNLFFYVYFF
jgi:hypothetical protein